MKAIVFLFLVLQLLVAGCHQRPFSALDRPIVMPEDYGSYLSLPQPEHELPLSRLQDEIEFWKQRLALEPNGYLYMQKLSGVYTSMFEHSRQLSYLDSAKMILRDSDHLNSTSGKVGNLQQLVTLSITMHQFQKARDYAAQAYILQPNNGGNALLMFDVSMELGRYADAARYLERVEPKTSFDYLVRLAKLQDHQGDLAGAIHSIEKAAQLLERYDKPSLTVWVETQLGDFYGHAGRLEEAYQSYLRVQAIEPGHAHSLKGIAWIAFSHDRNVAEAKRIARYLLEQQHLPEMHLLLAEIADYENDGTARHHQLQQFLAKIEGGDFRGMYDQYRVKVAAQLEDRQEQSLVLAEKEVALRPTPQSYVLLAWAHHKMGEHKRALAIAEDHVIGQTGEPEVLYRLGMIYQSGGRVTEGRALLNEALESSFELGPVITRRIEEALTT